MNLEDLRLEVFLHKCFTALCTKWEGLATRATLCTLLATSSTCIDTAQGARNTGATSDICARGGARGWCEKLHRCFNYY
jgi:hypothetical protein